MWYKWSTNRCADWNKFIRAKYGCSRSEGLGEVLSNKNISSVFSGIINVNNPKGFNTNLSVDKFEWVLRDGLIALFWEYH